VILYYVLVLSLPLVSHPLFGSEAGGITFEKYLGFLCLGYALLTLVGRRRGPRLFGTPQARWFTAFVGLVVLSYVTSRLGPQPGEWAILVIYASHFAFFVTTLILVDSLERLRRVLLVAIGSTALASLYVLKEWVGGSAIYGADYRPGYVTGDPNFFAASAVLCLPLALEWSGKSQRPAVRIYCLGCLVLGLAATMVAASRGGFLGLLAGMGFMAWSSRHRMRSLAVGGALLIAFLLVSPSSPLRRIVSPDHSDVESQDARLSLWGAGLRMVRDHPLAGVGIGNFKHAARAYGDAEGDVWRMAHNAYLEIAAEMGLPGLTAFVGVIYLSCRSMNRLRRRMSGSGPPLLHEASTGIQAGLIGFAVALFFVSGWFLKLFWLMVFLSMAAPALRPRAQADQGYAAA
jgi:putative inorganic carbon (HCO3(-)) transporter